MKKTPGKTPAARERYWTKIIVEARAYADGITAYCARHGIMINNYYAWFRKLRHKHPEWEDLGNSANRNGRKTDTQPDTEVVEKAVRRTFSAAYKNKILREAEVTPAGEVASLLRREGLYSSHLQKWRTAEQSHAMPKRGPKVNPLAHEVKQLRADNASLVKQLQKAAHLIDLQKKIAEVLGETLESQDEK
jgi:transposase